MNGQSFAFLGGIFAVLKPLTSQILNEDKKLIEGENSTKEF